MLVLISYYISVLVQTVNPRRWSYDFPLKTRTCFPLHHCGLSCSSFCDVAASIKSFVYKHCDRFHIYIITRIRPAPSFIYSMTPMKFLSRRLLYRNILINRQNWINYSLSDWSRLLHLQQYCSISSCNVTTSGRARGGASGLQPPTLAARKKSFVYFVQIKKSYIPSALPSQRNVVRLSYRMTMEIRTHITHK